MNVFLHLLIFIIQQVGWLLAMHNSRALCCLGHRVSCSPCDPECSGTYYPPASASLPMLPCQVSVVLGLNPNASRGLPARRTLLPALHPSPPSLSYVKVPRLTTPSDLGGNVQVLNTTVLTVLCLCKYIRMYSAPSSPELPFFMVNGLSPLSSHLQIAASAVRRPRCR